MKQKITILLLAASFSLFSSATNAGALKPDCSVKKAGKSAAMKAAVGVLRLMQLRILQKTLLESREKASWRKKVKRKIKRIRSRKMKTVKRMG